METRLLATRIGVWRRLRGAGAAEIEQESHTEERGVMVQLCLSECGNERLSERSAASSEGN